MTPRILIQPHRCLRLARLLLVLCLLHPLVHRIQSQDAVSVLPAGVEAVWDLSKASHETTPTRERTCLNGLWRWQPGETAADAVPATNWGYFKVPGCWPGITDYMQKDCQRVFSHLAWANTNLSRLTTAWYEREISIPTQWTGRRIAISAEYLNSFAAVFIDGRPAGEIRFPGGELDLTSACKPGHKHTLSLFVAAMPLKGVLLSYTDSASARTVSGKVPRRGLCGDVFLVSTPAGPRVTDIRVATSVRHQELSVTVALTGFDPDTSYSLETRIMDGDRTVRQFAPRPLRAVDLTGGRITLSEQWMAERLWDIHTPQNLYSLQVTLRDAAGKVLDTAWMERFGFREFWIQGRDFFLNGSRIYLSAVPLDNAQVSAGLATYEAAHETFERLQSFGINYVYTHNYDCEPGSHLSFAEILRAADDAGMLIGLSQPHFSHYDWRAPDGDVNNGYARHAEFYVRAAQNHPSVVMYSMSHNATGYNEDMNPDLIDGLHDPRDSWASRNAQMALSAEAIVRHLDPSRIVYHHASGNLSSMHVINFYPNFVPIQELSDWFEHWANTGVKPVFTCEYGAPFTWDWTMYRGWFKGQREFGSATVPWEFCLAEWNAQFYGDRAFLISDAEKANLRWEADQFQKGRTWHRWDYPVEVGSSRFEERYPIFAAYLTDNWRAFRTWGVSATSPWEYAHFWKLREGADQRPRELPVEWQSLQRPGFSPDFIGERCRSMELGFEREDWIPTPAAQALVRNNRPLLGYIAGKSGAFTSKDHNFQPGEIVDKQLIILNNSRRSVSCEYEWSLALPDPLKGSARATISTGEQQRIPLRLALPENLSAGSYELTARFSFEGGETQTDTFTLDVLPRSALPLPAAKIALFDPVGETASLLRRLQVNFQTVRSHADLASFDLLVIGKAALTLAGPAPDLSRVPRGLKVIVFEQTSDVLEKRLGFRVEEYGLRKLFARVPDHPALKGLNPENLGDWRGEATILPPRLTYQSQPRLGPVVQWSGLPVPHLWRCGNRGNVASVLIEKPACGDFLPVLDGGFGLQFSPLLEYHEGQGMILFCQVDVTGRTEVEPTADRLVPNLLRYAANWQAAPARQPIYAGEPDGLQFLKSIGVSPAPFSTNQLTPDHALIVGLAAEAELTQAKALVQSFMSAGGKVLALGLDSRAADWLPFQATFQPQEHIAAWFEPPGTSSPFAGLSPAEVQNHAPRELPLLGQGAKTLGDGVLASAPSGNVVFCQLLPWQFGTNHQANLRRTRRTSSRLVSRLVANLGVAAPTPLLERLQRPVAKDEHRWLAGLYLDQPEEWDDPYRFFRW